MTGFDDSMASALRAALVDVMHYGDYGTLWVQPERRLVHLTMGDADGDDATTGFDEIRRIVTTALQQYWPGWSAGSSWMGGLDGSMEIADEWDPNEDEGWMEIGPIGREA